MPPRSAASQTQSATGEEDKRREGTKFRYRRRRNDTGNRNDTAGRSFGSDRDKYKVRAELATETEKTAR